MPTKKVINKFLIIQQNLLTLCQLKTKYENILNKSQNEQVI